MKLSVEQDGRSASALRNYLSEINQHALLSATEERKLAQQLKMGHLEAGHRLVTANLRFVVKIAREYSSYGAPLPDMIQEGNLGLMKAVQKFDPSKKIRLISYAVWWIRAYIQNYILKSWSLIKLGTTLAQRKLFYSLARTRRQLERMGGDPDAFDAEKIARMLRVRPKEVEEMQQRMNGRDISLEAPLRDGGEDFVTLANLLVSPVELQDEACAKKEEATIASCHVQAAVARLDPRERYIIEQRVMTERPTTLKRLGEYFGFSRERARQIEIRAKRKLRSELEEFTELLHAA
jgi:RNA polymerase sigma-32 factor